MCYAHLFSTIRGKVEHQHGQEGDAHAWDDQVDCVEQGLTPHGDVEGDVQVWLITAGVKLDVSKEMLELKKFLNRIEYLDAGTPRMSHSTDL